MNDSNQSLRFSRTAREAYGHDISFDEGYRAADRIILLLAVFSIGLCLGSLL